ncbi:hypothetical protein KR026_012431 [Drosophila bipectinata]|nr:hypothetical protein KR026_012431 [Drosophila bipectinata]
MFSTRTGITRFNLSNAEEALFSLENLDTLTSMMVQENNSLRLRIYSYNQKDRSVAYLLPDFIIGSTAYKTDDDVTLTLSPVIVGSVLTIIIIGVHICAQFAPQSPSRQQGDCRGSDAPTWRCLQGR